ncbi:MAG: holo-[acyl-carrier-protein] synthase [Desulfuromonadaceae bacterium]|nr:holo-[acyl-carrier-protein] synthase [Desulfuromonadaceae bacterium]
MIYGIGTDIVEIVRFQRFLDAGNSALLDRLFTLKEQSRCSSRKDAASCLAGRFAAKEAFLKALGTGLRDGISWLDMEVVNDSLGKPELLLSGKAAERYQCSGMTRVHVSLSHDGGNAIAIVLLESA